MDRYIEALKQSKTRKLKTEAKQKKRIAKQVKRIQKQTINESKPHTGRVLNPYSTIIQKRETINPNITQGDIANIIKEGQKSGKNYDDILREIEARKKLASMFNIQRSAQRLQLGEKPKVVEKHHSVKQMDELLAKLDTIATNDLSVKQMDELLAKLDTIATNIDDRKESKEPTLPKVKRIYRVKANAHLDTYVKFFQSMVTFKTFKEYVESHSGKPFIEFVEWLRNEKYSIVNDSEKLRLIFQVVGDDDDEYDFDVVFNTYLIVGLGFNPNEMSPMFYSETPREHQYDESPAFQTPAEHDSLSKQLFKHEPATPSAHDEPLTYAQSAATPRKTSGAKISKQPTKPETPSRLSQAQKVQELQQVLMEAAQAPPAQAPPATAPPATAPPATAPPAEADSGADPAENDTSGYTITKSSHKKSEMKKSIDTYFNTYKSNSFSKNKIYKSVLLNYLFKNKMESKAFSIAYLIPILFPPANRKFFLLQIKFTLGNCLEISSTLPSLEALSTIMIS